MISILLPDETIVDIPLVDVRWMETLDKMVEDLGTKIQIPLENVDLKTLQKIAVWIKHQTSKDLKPENLNPKDIDGKFEPDPWTADWLNMNMPLLLKVYKASDYLEIPYLIDLISWAIAKKINGKTPEQTLEILEF